MRWRSSVLFFLNDTVVVSGIPPTQNLQRKGGIGFERFGLYRWLRCCLLIFDFAGVAQLVEQLICPSAIEDFNYADVAQLVEQLICNQ